MGIFKKDFDADAQMARASSEKAWPALPATQFYSKDKLTSAFLVNLTIGIILIIAGFILEAYPETVDSFWNKLRTLGEVSTAHASGGAAGKSGALHDLLLFIQPPHESSSGSHRLTLTQLMVLLLKELGVAWIVAAIISLFLEKKVRKHDSERHHRLQMNVAENAVFALFGLSHDREFVQAVVDTNLKAAIVRTNLTQVYKLRNLTEKEARLINPKAPEDALGRFLILDMEQHYIFKNVSSAPLHHEIPLAVARRRGAGASDVTMATYVSLGQIPLSPAEIEAGIDKGGSEDHYLRYAWNRTIPAHGSLQVVANVACLKERSDNEVWGSFFPTMGEVTLTLEVLEGMNFGLRPISNADTRRKDEVPSACRKSWVLSGPLLRHNSAVFWWRTYADDGLLDEASPVGVKADF